VATELPDRHVGLLGTWTHRLVWRLGLRGLQLKNVLGGCLTRPDRSRRLQCQVDAFGSDLNRLFGDYRESKKRAAFTDQLRMRGIKDMPVEIIEAIPQRPDNLSRLISAASLHYDWICDSPEHECPGAGQLNTLLTFTPRLAVRRARSVLNAAAEIFARRWKQAETSAYAFIVRCAGAPAWISV